MLHESFCLLYWDKLFTEAINVTSSLSLSLSLSHIILQMTLMVSDDQIIGDSIAFALGLATTLALLGIGASFAGKAYGQIGQGLPLTASGLAVLMGLNLLEVLIKLLYWFWAFVFITFISTEQRA